MDNRIHPLYKVLKEVEVNSCPLNMNFHCHTKCSDGSLEPEELVTQANKLKLAHLAITDHHTVEAYNQVTKYGRNHFGTTNIWSGIEITALLNNCLVHILGLGFDHNHEAIKPYIYGQSNYGFKLQAKSVVRSIQEAGGLSILAHPARYRLSFKELINYAYELNFDGIEVWYDYDRQKDWNANSFVCNEINKQVSELKLLKTCGTDTHGSSLLRR